MKIEILCTGDEILSGKTINTNHSYIARRLVENGFNAYWGTTVGDHRSSLISAFHRAAERADVVIVNGGLGPTVDDLSQEVAAEAAGVKLILHENWLHRIQSWYTARGREMPSNNTKQALLPAEAEFIDNPIGTACGFAVDIESTRFFFTPGVPIEMRMMIDDQIIPRLQKIRGGDQITKLKRFHTFGIGESRADQLLAGVEQLITDDSIKLGFQSHYPQLETKLAAQGLNQQEVDTKLAPIMAFVRERLGHFVISEDDATLEGRIIEALAKEDGNVCLLEMHTGGALVARLQKVADTDQRVSHGLISQDPYRLFDSVGLDLTADTDWFCEQTALELAEAARLKTGSSHSLVVLVEIDTQSSARESGAEILIAISNDSTQTTRRARLPGSENWIRLGAAELGLDCFRRFLYNLPVYQQIDFEQH